MTFCQLRMIKIFGRIANQADFFHDSPRSEISWNREGNQFVELQRYEGMTQDCFRAFARKTLVPVLSKQSPANLDAGRKFRRELRNSKPYEANKGPGFMQLSGKQAKTVFSEMLLYSIHERVTFLGG